MQGFPRFQKLKHSSTLLPKVPKAPNTFIAIDRWWEALAQNRSSLACGTPRRPPAEAASSLMYTCYYYHLENCVAASPLSSSSPGRIALDARAVRRVASCLVVNSAIPTRAMQALDWGDLLGPIGAGWCVSPQHSQGSFILPAVRSSCVSPPAAASPNYILLTSYKFPHAPASWRIARTPARTLKDCL